MIRGTESREATLSLIMLSPRDENILRRELHPNEFKQLLQYRREVLREFERLVPGAVKLHSFSASPSA